MSRPLRIVLVLPQPPLPFGGAAARTYYTLQKGLVERGHELVTFVASHSEATRSETRTLFPTPQHDVRFFAEPASPRSLRRRWKSLVRPYSYPFTRELRGALDRELEGGFDVLHICEHMTGYVGQRFASRALVSTHFLYCLDRAGIAPRDLRDSLLRARLFQVERQLLRAFPHHHALSSELAHAIRTVHPSARVEVAPLSLDLSLYPYGAEADRPSGEKRVALIGTFHWLPTQLAANRLLRLWPHIQARVPDARLELTGRTAKQFLAGRTLGPEILVTEDVPDILPYFRRANVFVYPAAQGSGMKVKILEAMALGVPVVTTPAGIEGLPAENGTHVALATSDEALVEETVRLLEDPARQARQRTAARALVATHCDPERVLDEYERFYNDVAATASTRAAG